MKSFRIVYYSMVHDIIVWLVLFVIPVIQLIQRVKQQSSFPTGLIVLAYAGLVLFVSIKTARGVAVWTFSGERIDIEPTRPLLFQKRQNRSFTMDDIAAWQIKYRRNLDTLKIILKDHQPIIITHNDLFVKDDFRLLVTYFESKVGQHNQNEIRRNSAVSGSEIPVMQNDKLIQITGTSSVALKKVLKDFFRNYAEDGILVEGRLTEYEKNSFYLNFPADISFEIFCYLVNYLKYPIDSDMKASVTGWATAGESDHWITPAVAGQPLMLYVPADDTDYDIVHCSCPDNQFYEISFSADKIKNLKDGGESYVPPPVNPAELSIASSEKFNQDI